MRLPSSDLSTIALSRSMEGSPRPFQLASVLDFGADPTGVLDSTAAIQNAINSTPGLLYFPPGTYLHHGLTVTSFCTMVGETGIYGRTTLLAADGTPDHILFLPGSQGSSLRQFHFAPQHPAGIGYGSATGDGVAISAPYICLEDVYVDSAGGNGIHVRDDSRATIGADLFRMWNVSVSNNAMNGIAIDGGGDNNAGIIVGADSRGNHLFAYRDHSLANTWVGFYAIGNTGGTMDGGSICSSALFGCSAEDGNLGTFGNMSVYGGNMFGSINTARPFMWKVGTPPNAYELVRWNDSPGSGVPVDLNACFSITDPQSPASRVNPIGWSSSDHPVGAGHLVSVHPWQNSRCHFTLSQVVTLGPNETRIVTFEPESYALESFVPLGLEGEDLIGIAQSLQFADTDLPVADVSILGWSIQNVSPGGDLLRTRLRNNTGSSLTFTLFSRVTHYSGSAIE